MFVSKRVCQVVVKDEYEGNIFYRANPPCVQFWAAYVPCDAQHRDAVQLTFEQIDLIQRLTDKYHPQLTLCTSADGELTTNLRKTLLAFTSLPASKHCVH